MQHLFMHQCALALQYFNNVIIRLENMLTGKQLGVGQKTAATVDRVINRQVITTADHIVILTMTGSGMHSTGAGLCRHVITKNNRHLTIIERVPQQLPFQIAALAVGNHLVLLDTKTQHHILEQGLGQQQPLGTRIGLTLHHGVFKFRIQ